jgi:hypothetical protein
MVGTLEQDFRNTWNKREELLKRWEMLRDALQEAKVVAIYFNKTSI